MSVQIVCSQCGNPQNNHPYRHPFTPAPDPRPSGYSEFSSGSLNDVTCQPPLGSPKPTHTHWPARFMELAFHVAEWSKDPSTKVGAVIVDAKRRIVSMGYNGFPRGVRDSQERLEDRPVKYLHVVHAELNAILNSTRVDMDDCILYVTHVPCTGCAKAIIQSGIKKVFVATAAAKGLEGWQAEQLTARDMMKESGITMFQA